MQFEKTEERQHADVGVTLDREGEVDQFLCPLY
jgi:hypothetical protein